MKKSSVSFVNVKVQKTSFMVSFPSSSIQKKKRDTFLKLNLTNLNINESIRHVVRNFDQRW